jgi:complement component 1 Q subcomponent-binding protein, mitochondrial
MISVRAALRSAPRNIARFSTSQATPFKLARQNIGVLRSSQSQSPYLAALRSSSLRGLSTSAARREPAGETDEELSAKLESEIQFEKEVKEAEPLPASVKDFLENGPFEITDIPGQEEVVLTRTFGNEKWAHPIPCAWLSTVKLTSCLLAGSL